MDHPYRSIENENIIVAARLDALEKEASAAWLWRAGGFIIMTILTVVISIAVGKAKNGTSTCVDEAKVVLPNGGSVSCTNRNHDLAVATDGRDVVIRCACRKENVNK